MGSLMLICAVAASLAFGVLVAYGICQVMFRIFRVHQTAVAKTRMAAPMMRARSPYVRLSRSAKSGNF